MSVNVSWKSEPPLLLCRISAQRAAASAEETEAELRGNNSTELQVQMEENDCSSLTVTCADVSCNYWMSQLKKEIKQDFKESEFTSDKEEENELMWTECDGSKLRTFSLRKRRNLRVPTPTRGRQSFTGGRKAFLILKAYKKTFFFKYIDYLSISFISVKKTTKCNCYF